MAFHSFHSGLSHLFLLIFQSYTWLRAEQWPFCSFLKMCLTSGMYSHSQIYNVEATILPASCKL